MKMYAYTGIAGALTMALADIILLGQPVSGSYYDLSGLGAMGMVSMQRAQAGTLLGLAASFFICFGYWHLRQVFAPANKAQAGLLFIALSSTMFFGGAFHAGYYFLALPESGPHVNVLTQQQYTHYLELISYMGVPGFIIGSVLFFKLALSPTYPVWLKYGNPLIITLLVLIPLYLLPTPVGGYIRPAFINLATAIVFALSLKATNNYL